MFKYVRQFGRSTVVNFTRLQIYGLSGTILSEKPVLYIDAPADLELVKLREMLEEIAKII